MIWTKMAQMMDGGRTMLGLLRLVPFDRGWATPAGPRAASRRPLAGSRRPPRRSDREHWGGFSETFLCGGFCNMFQHFAIGSFLPAKTWPISCIAASNKVFPMCLATGRMYLRTTGMATLPIRTQTTRICSHLSGGTANFCGLLSCRMGMAFSLVIVMSLHLYLEIEQHRRNWYNGMMMMMMMMMIVWWCWWFSLRLEKKPFGTTV